MWCEDTENWLTVVFYLHKVPLWSCRKFTVEQPRGIVFEGGDVRSFGCLHLTLDCPPWTHSVYDCVDSDGDEARQAWALCLAFPNQVTQNYANDKAIFGC